MPRPPPAVGYDAGKIGFLEPGVPDPNLLRQIEIFRNLPDGELGRLAKSFVELRVPAEHRIFSEGTESAAFFVIREGTVVIYRDAVGKPAQLLARLGPGDYFGELGLFEDARHTSSARATEPARLLKIHNEELLAFLDDHPDIAIRLQMAAAKRHTINAAAALELGERSDLRIRVNQEVVLTFGDGKTHVVVLDNLSPGGLSLQGAPAHWALGDELRFDLGYGAHRLDCQARVAWIQGESLGLAFTETQSDHAERVRSLLRYFLRRVDNASARVSSE